MSQDHPDPEALARYARGELSREESRALERHLTACVWCQSQVDGLPARSAGEGAGSVRWQGHRFARVPDPERLAERRENLLGVVRALGDILAATSESSAARLLSAPEHRRRALLRDDERFHTLGLCELLQARCRAEWGEDPGAAVESAKLAVLVAQRLSPEAYGARRVEDARAAAQIHLGISFRLASGEPPAGWEEVAEPVEDPADPDEYRIPSATMLLRDRPDPVAAVEAGLREARDAFLERGMVFDAALATLDLAALHLKGRRPGQVSELAAESLDLFAAQGADPYVLDSLGFLRELAESEAGVAPEDLGRMARLLQRRRSGSRERFRGEE